MHCVMPNIKVAIYKMVCKSMMMMNAEKIIPTVLFSRLFMIVFAIIGDLLIPDHIPQGADLLLFTEKSSIFLQPFMKWDSIHYLNIARNNYQLEKQFVFLPGFPFTVRFLSITIPFQFIGMSMVDRFVIGALLLNSVCVIISCYQLVSILRSLKIIFTTKDTSLCITIFCFCPASIFFFTGYTEALFSALSWSGLAIAFGISQQNYLFSKNSWEVVFGLLISLVSCICLAAASSVRMNGSLNCVIIIIKYLADPIRFKKGKILYYEELKRMLWSSVLCACSSFPGMWWEAVSEKSICIDSSVTRSERTNHFCNNSRSYPNNSSRYMVPRFQSMYAHLQRQYWNVGFLQYWRWNQTPNFLLAIPILLISVHAMSGSRLRVNKERNNHRSIFRVVIYSLSRQVVHFSPFQFSEFAINRISYFNQQLSNTLELPTAPLQVHLCLLLLIGFFLANVQITTRLVCSASPIVYIGFINVLKYGKQWQRNLCIFYLVIYNIGGILLHCNFYPWT